MVSSVRLSIRASAVGAWAVLLGGTLVYGIDRLLGLLGSEGAKTSSLTAAGLPIVALAETALVNVYNGSAFSVFVGLLLVLGGWYQLLRLSTKKPA
ncbi:MAG: hypothetical protein ACLFNC_00280 [Halodesulfurarchaeum sp.]